MAYLKVFVVMLITWLCAGCSSTLRSVERDSSLDRIETLKGKANQDGNFGDRQESLAEQEIRDREVVADAKKGYKVLIVNASSDEVRIEIRKESFFFINPLLAKFAFYGRGSKEHFLMPGKYDISCYLGGILQWTKVYEVTTAPQWDDQAKVYYYCVIRNILVPYSQLGDYYRRY